MSQRKQKRNSKFPNESGWRLFDEDDLSINPNQFESSRNPSDNAMDCTSNESSHNQIDIEMDYEIANETFDEISYRNESSESNYQNNIDDDEMIANEILRMKKFFNFDDDDGDKISDQLDFQVDKDSAIDRFMLKYLQLIVKDNIPYTHMDRVLKLMKTELNLPINTSHSTIINKYVGNHLEYDYFIKCECGQLISVKRNERANVIKCDQCRVNINFKEFIKSHDHTCVFSIQDQIKNISQVVSRDKLINPPESRDEPMKMEMLLTLDGMPDSDSSKVEDYPLLLYVDNIRSKYFMEKYPIYKTVTLFTSKSEKNNYDQVLVPLLDELESIPDDGFETEWSKHTTIQVKLVIADAKMRAVIMNFLQHNGKKPCHKCHIVFDCNFIFPCLPSTELRLRKKEEIQISIDKLNEQRKKAKNITQLKALTNHDGVKGHSLLAPLGLDLIKTVIIDIVHCVYLGVTKNFVGLFLEDVYKPQTPEQKKKKEKKEKNDYYLDPKQKEVLNNRLSEIKTPSSISRPFRSLEQIADFKAKEFENFLFFGSYYALYDVFDDDRYFNHFMLLNKAIHSLYSSTASEDDIELAKYEIDLFLSVLNELNYSDSFFQYNTHCLPHLYEDRIEFGQPLSRYNAYGYESELQILKAFSKSKNKRVETLANKIALRSVFKMYTIESDEEVLEKDRVYINKNTVPVKKIMSLLHINKFEELKFYQKANIRNKIIRIRGCSKTEDSFVKIRDLFYQVTLVFKFNNQNMILCEHIPIRRKIECKVKTYSFELPHHNVIDLERRKEKECFVFRLSEIKTHVLHVKIDEVFENLEFIIDLED